MIPCQVPGVGFKGLKPTSTPIPLDVDANFRVALWPKWPRQADTKGFGLKCRKRCFLLNTKVSKEATVPIAAGGHPETLRSQSQSSLYTTKQKHRKNWSLRLILTCELLNQPNLKLNLLLGLQLCESITLLHCSSQFKVDVSLLAAEHNPN